MAEVLAEGTASLTPSPFRSAGVEGRGVETSCSDKEIACEYQTNTPVAAAMGVFAFWAGAIFRQFPLTNLLRSVRASGQWAEMLRVAFTRAPLQPARSSPSQTAGVKPAAIFMPPFRTSKNRTQID
jgi:hypothetical protein